MKLKTSFTWIFQFWDDYTNYTYYRPVLSFPTNCKFQSKTTLYRAKRYVLFFRRVHVIDSPKNFIYLLRTTEQTTKKCGQKTIKIDNVANLFPNQRTCRCIDYLAVKATACLNYFHVRVGRWFGWVESLWLGANHNVHNPTKSGWTIANLYAEFCCNTNNEFYAAKVPCIQRGAAVDQWSHSIFHRLRISFPLAARMKT